MIFDVREKLITLLICLFCLGCGQRAIQHGKNWYIADDIFGNLVTDKTTSNVRRRMESTVKKILKDLNGFRDDQIIVIDSLFENKSFFAQDVSLIRREVRSHIPSGKATDPLKETARNLREIFEYLHNQFYFMHIMDVEELLIGK